MIGIVAGGILLCPVAKAENKLFITDVLDSRQMEAQATLRSTRSSNVSFTSPGLTGNGYRNTTRATVSLGGGLGDGVQVDATLPYVFVDKEYDTFAGVTTLRDRSGVGDPTVGLKFRISGTEAGARVVTARLDYKPDSADPNRAGTGATNISFQLAASFRSDDSLRRYGVYQATFRNNGQADTHSLRFGSEKAFSEDTSATLEATAFLNTASDTEASYNTFGISLFSYLQVGRNLYLIPELDYSWVGERKSIDGFSRIGRQTGTAASLGVYYLF